MNLSFGLIGGSLTSAETERKLGTMPRTRLVCWAPLELTASGLSVVCGPDGVEVEDGACPDCGEGRALVWSGSAEAERGGTTAGPSFEELAEELLVSS